MTNAIRFWLGNAPCTVTGPEAAMSLLDWLRLNRARTGTKEGCNEGDCGACTILAVRLDADGETLVWKALNACIQYVYMLDNTQIFTIEDLAGGYPAGNAAAPALHPMQTAMIDHGGSQCGFCTPGFIMAMTAAATDPATGGPDALSGNLCRCTGYAPILRALEEATPATKAWADTLGTTIRDRLRALDRTTPLHIDAGATRIDIPRTADQLAELCASHPDATLLAGATDIGIWINKGGRTLPHVILTTTATDLNTIREDDVGLTIGAAATWEQALPALTRLLPAAEPTLRRLGGRQVRAAGTVCGNIANGSPIGDGPPILIAANATLTLRHGNSRRTLPLEDYFIDYGKQDRRPGEFVEAVHVPHQPESLFRTWKISKRHDQDISAILCACRLTVTDGLITDARIAFGGMAATSKRAPRAEAALTGTPFDATALARAQDAITQDYAPISDFRASAAYRLTVARNLMTRLHHAHLGQEESVHA
ncbi:xanthine dehydrogenase small subunit [Tanticharoenia sakaeratensis]|uniref:Xanthine dehydrogenase small subunit n=1 Tax=Tanticharoenia sakaeratensis NBRC 103193 TaxID=1231623 RepID=A0A0D6MMR2_9PROT|nr:xanthine dehydrogenase small subunit [Tanticharoenia sakaeratensis]GAN54967.1 xanthine dehydrogenase small subunit [Tanticharoenia sakaeratensis NBRC 103193]GBQ16668.1 xanthine dehydrogenase XdhA [Tanticharoenia sakaeratensis NBRC 103193]